ncbi:aureocin A53 family class IId bacteriocin [Marinococcus sp. PL1-022]|uniref:aureocin A53 family class IId bacteriocin n=1 Tax=Marinococcus sp. PL1-022 TaxID=3095363 RepID=UPI0029C1361C|nr:aureocin A53 family class IId bacteriocin [Marinococcus sp. PL1-022]MDX6154475.1 aureocin A53 family class IId bacteriocin [Marinococcus sp. PL1-022]
MIAVLRAAATAGKAVYNFVKNNIGRVRRWVADGLAVDAIIQRIKEIVGAD